MAARRVDGKDRAEVMRLAAKSLALGTKLLGERIGVIRDADCVGGVYSVVDSLDGRKIEILRPDTVHAPKPLLGRVVSIGLGIPADLGLLPGDRVTFTKYNPTEFELELGDETVFVEVMHASDLYYVWRD